MTKDEVHTMKSLDYKVVDLDGKAICYFETELEAEEFIHTLEAKDEFRIEEVNHNDKVDELRKELYEHCDKTETSRKGIEYLVNYYINSLGWTEENALIYAIGLFHNDTIRQIKLFGSDGEEI